MSCAIGSFSLPAHNADAFSVCREDCLFDETGKWAQLALVITGIAAVTILSLAGVLSSSVALVVGISVGALAVEIGASALHMVAKFLLGQELNHNSEYQELLKQLPPLIPTVVVPVIEEVLFRVIIQGGIYAVAATVFPTMAITVCGLSFPLATAISVVAAGVVFGAVHVFNPHDDAVFQAIIVGVSGIAVSGPLYAYYGLWASTLAHIVNNTILVTALKTADSLESV